MGRKHIILYPTVLIIALLVLGSYWFLHAENDLHYDGEYVDLIAESEFQQKISNGLSVKKIQRDTGFLACAALSSNGKEMVYPKFIYEGVPVQLRFENDVLTGYRPTCNGEVLNLLGRHNWDTLSAEDRSAIESVALYKIMTNETWISDEDSLRSVLYEYTSQVLSLQQVCGDASSPGL